MTAATKEDPLRTAADAAKQRKPPSHPLYSPLSSPHASPPPSPRGDWPSDDSASTSSGRSKHGVQRDKVRSFPPDVKRQCWEKAKIVPGRDPKRWRQDALGNVLSSALSGCDGCACHSYDHIVPHSLGGPSTLENCQLMQARANRVKGNRKDATESELIQGSAYCRLTGRDMEVIEMAAYGNVSKRQARPDEQNKREGCFIS
eukprot:jgi/Mesvir1/12759/Mv22823-RA.1